MADINISGLSHARFSKADLEKHFANDASLDKILLIFDKINMLDEQAGETLSSIDFFEMNSLNQPKKGVFASLDESNDNNITEYELNCYFNDAKKFYGDEINIEDYKKFLEYAASKGRDALVKVYEEVSQKTGMSNELIDKLGGPYAVSEFKLVERDNKKYYERESDGYSELRDLDGNLLERREKESIEIGYEGCEKVETYGKDGTTTENYINHETGEQTMFQYDVDAGTVQKMHLKDNVAVRQSKTIDGSHGSDMRLDDIVFGAGTNDSTKVSFKYDENNRLAGLDIQDMKTPKKVLIKDELERIAYITEQTTVDDVVAEAIQEMLDGGGRYGEDFDLEVKDGKLKLVPKVINETDGDIPELAGDAFNRYKELIGKGVHAGEDFDVIYQEDGTFRFDLKNNQATDFGASYKNEIYDSNGNFLSSLTVVGDKVIKETALNGERNTVEMPFEEAFMQLLIEGNFSIAGEILGKNDLLSGGYNIYKSADQYKQIFGRELIADVCDKKEVSKNSREQKAYKNLLNKLLPHSVYYGQSKEYAIQDYIDGYNEIKFVLDFDPYDSKMAGILPNNERIMNGEKSFTERCNNDKFEVEYDDKTIKISKNGKGVKEVDVSNLPPSYVQENLVKIPASVLYDMAICDIKLKVDDTVCERAAGYYKPTENSISLDPNETSSNRLLQVIVHESGHMCDFINDVENAKRAVKELMKDPMMHIGRDKPLTLSEAVENLGTNQSVAIQDEKLSEIYKKEYENFIKNCPKINNSFTYALTDMVEFFAESYTLLNMGADKSEYVLINYFPQSLQRAKEIMEANREFHEKN